MDKAILIGSLLIALTFIIAFTISVVSQTYYTFFVQFYSFFNALTITADVVFPIGTLIIVLRLLQCAKFKVHKGTLFGLLLILSGVAILVTIGALINSSYSLQIKFFSEYNFIIIGAVLILIVGILILTIRTAIWGSKYVDNALKKVT